MAKERTVYSCQECGHNASRWMGRCPGCGSWNSLVEEKISSNRRNPEAGSVSSNKVYPIKEVQMAGELRRKTGVDEFDRVLGGGIVDGSLILVGGDPGIGKSTLLLEISHDLSLKGEDKILYISGEESPQQIRLRADRLNALSDRLYVAGETDLGLIKEHIRSIKPKMVVIDSIQTMYDPELSSAPGSIAQVRECTSQLMHLAKRNGLSIFLIGHVTKDGSIAGPMSLEHIVDVVLYLEGEKDYVYRILRAVKNRFGSTNEIGIFEMGDNGLTQVDNPSAIFLSQRVLAAPGSVVVASLEGTRPFLVELQALVTQTNFSVPQRIVTGLDYKRTSLLVAVLEKKVGLPLRNMDLFVNVVSGVRLNEPAVDLGVLVAIASSFRDLEVDARTVIIGEVGLSGEIRRVNNTPKRLNEAAKLGFVRAIVPAGGPLGKEGDDNGSDIEILPCETIIEALKHALSEHALTKAHD